MPMDRILGWLAAGVASTLLLPALACEEPPPPPEPGPRPIKMLRVGDDGEREEREYPGRIKAGQYSEMGFEVPGRVTEFVFTEGVEIDQGAVLARLDPRDYQARYDSAYAKLLHAESERDRFKEMYEKDVKPFSEYELRQRQLEVSQAEVREAQKALDDTVLVAPFEGVMAKKLVEEFENVVAKQAVLVLQNDDLLEIKVSVPERDIAEGDSVRTDVAELSRILSPHVVVSSLPGRTFPARVKELANVADETTRTFEATFLFDKPEDANILGGMTAKVVIEVPEEHAMEGVWIPSDATRSHPEGGALVWVVDAESMTATARPVQLGEMRGGQVLVSEGLQIGETIATSGVHTLTDGMSVRRYEP